jgi:hypothetical protein
MKINYLIFCVIFIQCQTKYIIYRRSLRETHEQLDINYRNGKFIYQADSSDLVYNAKGKLELVDSDLYLEFPENAEVNMLSPFKKGYSELIKTGESNQFEIAITNYDVRNKWELSPLQFKSTIEILNLVDSSLIKKLSYPLIQIQDSLGKVFIRAKVLSYFDQYIVIPGQGQYLLKLFLQPMQTIWTYETTTYDCNLVVSGPLFCLRTSEIENKLIKRLTPYGESFFSYPLVETPYLFVGIEKRKVKVFQ